MFNLLTLQDCKYFRTCWIKVIMDIIMQTTKIVRRNNRPSLTNSITEKNQNQSNSLLNSPFWANYLLLIPSNFPTIVVKFLLNMQSPQREWHQGSFILRNYRKKVTRWQKNISNGLPLSGKLNILEAQILWFLHEIRSYYGKRMHKTKSKTLTFFKY